MYAWFMPTNDDFSNDHSTQSDTNKFKKVCLNIFLTIIVLEQWFSDNIVNPYSS